LSGLFFGINCSEIYFHCPIVALTTHLGLGFLVTGLNTTVRFSMHCKEVQIPKYVIEEVFCLYNANIK
tara:strand:- start:9166 stop:9369 length:204 start_codon:yes stop_codon:yes gene_type:complete